MPSSSRRSSRLHEAPSGTVTFSNSGRMATDARSRLEAGNAIPVSFLRVRANTHARVSACCHRHHRPGRTPEGGRRLGRKITMMNAETENKFDVSDQIVAFKQQDGAARDALKRAFDEVKDHVSRAADEIRADTAAGRPIDARSRIPRHQGRQGLARRRARRSAGPAAPSCAASSRRRWRATGSPSVGALSRGQPVRGDARSRSAASTNISPR